ncbi:MAG: nucleotidyltransferase [Chitinivibrionales bacterium]|nr:nucleotidyltransferase [Chitinivibrionales bacterium]
MLITKDMLDFIRLLKKHKVEYMLVGGFAVIYYGYVRTTQDVDILIYPSSKNSLKLLAVLKEFGFGGAGFTKDIFDKPGAAIHLGVEPNRIDILTSLKSISNDSAFKNKKHILYKGISLNVISFTDLIECKRHSIRPKDLADVDELKKTAACKERRKSVKKKH